jgi:hypothetical protein
MAIDWSWSELISSVIGVIVGWIAKVFHGKANGS